MAGVHQRIHGELLKLGFVISEITVSRYMPRHPTDSAKIQRWIAFLRNHKDAIAAMDFFTVPTISLTLGLTWRWLETGLRTSLTGHEGGNPGYRQALTFELPRQPPTLPMRRMWKRSDGFAIEAPPHERGGNSRLNLRPPRHILTLPLPIIGKLKTLAPPGPRSLTSVVNKCARISRSFMGG